MIFLNGRTNSADRRLDHANNAIQSTLREIQETDIWVEEIEQRLSDTDLAQQVDIDELKAEITRQIKRSTTLSDRLTYLHDTMTRLHDTVTQLQTAPKPLIPDITPLRAEIRLVRAILDELAISHNDEMTYVWKALSSETRTRQEDLAQVHAKINNLPKPNFRPIYYSLAFLGFAQLCQMIISIFL